MNGVERCWRVWLCAWGAVLIGRAGARAAAVYEPAPFEHYQPILDRMPFGSPPASVNTMIPEQLELLKSEEQLLAEQQQVAQQIAFTALNVTPRGRTAVGFIDRSVNPPENYYLEVGAAAQGWTVLAADYDANWAQFEKNGVTITMHLHKGLIDGPPSNDTGHASSPPGAPSTALVVSEPPAEPPPAAAKRLSVPGLVRLPAAVRAAPPSESTQAAASPDPAPAPAKSYLERLRERKAQETADQKAAEKAARESLQELARKVAQDELAKREKEQVEALEQLRLQQVLFQAQQELEAQAQPIEQQPDGMQEQPLEAAPDPDAEPAPEEAAPEAQ